MALLARDDREVRASRIDLMFYRNFFIYVGSEYKNPVLETLEAPLREGGYLSCWARPKRCPPT